LQSELDVKRNSSYKGKFPIIIIILSILLVVGLIISISLGVVQINPIKTYRILLKNIFDITLGDAAELTKGAHFDIIWNIRFPRSILAMTVGAGLALCGVIMQATVQNPLADPYLLGISSGATFGATFAILIGVSGIFAGAGIAFWAFLGSVVASFLVITLANVGGKMSPIKLILSGVVVNAIFAAFTNFTIYIANNAEGIKNVTFWNMGSLMSAKWDNITVPVIGVSICVAFVLFQPRVLNTMLLGEEAAVTLGVDLNKYRWIFMIISSMVTAVIVATCGTIGFVGLIVPHIVRSLVGSDHKKLIPTSILAGAIFMLCADTLARTLIKNSEIPIGIITSLIGAPLFTYLMVKRSYGYGDK
jgi:iron complex transport system permease protein